MIRFRRRVRTESSLDLTPLIDVVFQLLIFFLLTSAFINPGISVDLPSAQSGDRGEDGGLSVSLDVQGRVFLGEREVTLESLGEELRREAGDNLDMHVSVWGDAGVPYGRLIRILDICRTSGLRRVVLMVRQDNQSP
jgi:biopolymer transport protein ExbD